VAKNGPNRRCPTRRNWLRSPFRSDSSWVAKALLLVSCHRCGAAGAARRAARRCLERNRERSRGPTRASADRSRTRLPSDLFAREDAGLAQDLQMMRHRRTRKRRDRRDLADVEPLALLESSRTRWRCSSPRRRTPSPRRATRAEWRAGTCDACRHPPSVHMFKFLDVLAALSSAGVTDFTTPQRLRGLARSLQVAGRGRSDSRGPPRGSWRTNRSSARSRQRRLTAIA